MIRNLILATEDELSEVVAERLVLASRNSWTISARIRRDGYGYLKSKVNELLRTAAKVPVFMLTDLDLRPCAPELIKDWVGTHSLPPGMHLRVAVREIEAWILADREGLSAYLGIAKDRFPENPESFTDPKQELLNLVRRYGSRTIRAELLPNPTAKAKVGIGYNATLTAFVRDEWDPHRAAGRSDSLARAMRSL